MDISNPYKKNQASELIVKTTITNATYSPETVKGTLQD
jgi:hypothetical protein